LQKVHSSSNGRLAGIAGRPPLNGEGDDFLVGTFRAHQSPVGARHFTDLVVWQLADDLRQFIHEITKAGPGSRDFRFRDQIRAASDSACDNTAEGFGRHGHREFSRFLSIAKASLDETESQLIGRFRKNYFTEDQVHAGRRQIMRTRKALLKLKRYLDRGDSSEPRGR
jgi:four helix bundle protein